MTTQAEIDWVLKNSYDWEAIFVITLKEEPSKELWFSDILPNLDYEIEGGTWENPLWAWEKHPWFKTLNLTKDECEEWFQNE